MKRFTTFLIFVFVGPMVGGLAFVGAAALSAALTGHEVMTNGLGQSVLGLVVAGGVFGLLYGLVPAAFTGAVAAVVVGRLRPSQFLPACALAGALVALTWSLWLLRDASVEPAMRVLWPLAGALAALASAALALRVQARSGA